MFIIPCAVVLGASQPKIDLRGVWKFAIDNQDKGVIEQWFSKSLSETVTLPGSMATNGKGFDVTLSTKWTGQIVDSSYYYKPEYAKYRVPGNIKVPFWLQPLKYYVGAAWYQKEVNIPKDWEDKDIRLFLERCHWESRLWIDDKEIGMRNSLGTPHLYDLSKALTPGKHILSICIDNRVKDIDPGINSHSISDHTQTNWNGIIGQLYLEARPKISIQNIQVFPDLQQKRIVAKVRIENSTKKSQKAAITLLATGTTTPESKNFNVDIAAGVDTLLLEYPMGNDVKLWSEFHPNVYQLIATLNIPKKDVKDSFQTSFGMREIKANGTQ